METKKNPEVDVHRWKAVFFNVGLCVSLSLVLLAFNYQQDAPELSEWQNDAQVEELVHALNTVQPPPPPPPKPKLVMPEIVPVEEVEAPEEVPDFTFEPTDEDLLNPDWGDFGDEDVQETPFEVVQHPATFVGGEKALFEYLSKTITYPAAARRMDIQGRVFVKFIVEKDGSITQAHVVRGIGAGCDEEALNAIQEMPAWDPPRQRGRKVRQWIMIPVNFKLQ